MTATTFAELFGTLLPPESKVEEGFFYGSDYDPKEGSLVATGDSGIFHVELSIDTEYSGTLFIKEKQRVIKVTTSEDLSEISFNVIIETPRKIDIIVISSDDAAIEKFEDYILVTLPDSLTDNTGIYNLGVREETTNSYFGGGSLTVKYAPHED
jgi:hypothetical protein